MTKEQLEMILVSWGLMKDSWPIERRGSVWMEYQVNFSAVMAAVMDVDTADVQAIMKGHYTSASISEKIKCETEDDAEKPGIYG